MLPQGAISRVVRYELAQSWCKSPAQLVKAAESQLRATPFTSIYLTRSGGTVKVEGACLSACTMVLRNPKACAMPGALFSDSIKPGGPALAWVKDHNEISTDGGGDLAGYLQVFFLVEASGSVVRVKDICASACTLI